MLDGSDNTERIRLAVFNDTDTPFLSLSDTDALVKAQLSVDRVGQGHLVLDGRDDTERVRLAVFNDTNNSFLRLRGTDTRVEGANAKRKAELGVDRVGQGYLVLDGSDNGERARLSVDDADDTGFLKMSGPNGERARLSVTDDNSGLLELYDSGGNVTITLDGSTGVISKSGMNGFRIAHPKDSSLEIFYTSLEGPEAGVYARGTATLQGGRAVVGLPDHFALVARDGTITVQLTPNSAETYGLAVVRKSPARIEVRELAGGKGSFSFDYTVTAARADIEPFEPVQKRAHSEARRKLKDEINREEAVVDGAESEVQPEKGLGREDDGAGGEEQELGDVSSQDGDTEQGADREGEQ